MASNNIRYLYSLKTGIEVIFCDNSAISYPTHNHISVLTIGIILNGSIVLTTNQEPMLYKKNQTFIIPPYIPHSILAHKDYTLLSLCIDKNIIMQYTTDIIQNHIITLLLDTLGTKNIYFHQILLLSNCLNSFVNYSNLTSNNQNPLIHNLKKQLEIHPENKLSIDEMAKNAFLSKYHFIRNFKAEVGLTPHQFQIQNRIRKAQRLIHKTGTITEVALATGFCDQSHFIKEFKKQVGLTPLTYKQASSTI